MKRKLLVITLASGINSLAGTSVYAQSTSLGIYPTLTKITAQPQTEVSIPLTITNSSSDEKLLSIEFRGFRPSGDSLGSIEYYTSKNIPPTLNSFLNTIKVFDKEDQIKSIKLYPNESKILQLTFPAPKNFSSDYYFSPIFTSQSPLETSDKSTTVKISQSIGSNVLLSVEPLQKPKTHISELYIPPIIFDGPLRFSLRLENTAVNFSTTEGKISIYNLTGKKIAEKNIPESVILADSFRSEKIEIDEKFLGIYKAQASLRVNDTSLVIRETHFLYIPLFILVSAVVVLFILFGIGFRIIRKLNFKQA